MVAWVVEHAADVLSKYAVGTDGRAAYEMMKGKPCSHELVEFGRKPLQTSQGRPGHEEKLDGKGARGISWASSAGLEKPLWGVLRWYAVLLPSAV